MAATLPTPGKDAGTWGTILNDFLLVSHNSNGTLKTSAVSTAGAITTSEVGAANGVASLSSSGVVPSSQLGAGSASNTTYLRGDGTWDTPSGGGGGSSTLASDTDVSITSPTNNQVLTYNSGANKWVNQTPAASPVSSVFGRTGTITAQTGDYTASQVSGALVNSNNLSDVSSAATAFTTIKQNATNASTGVIQLAGDLAGTAASPTVAKVNGVSITGTPSNNALLVGGSSSVAAWQSSPLGISQGGTASTTQNFVDLTTTQNIGGNKTFTGTTTTFNGEVIVPTPTNNSDAATKAYVDSTSEGLDPKQSVAAATITNLPANTYNNGTSGVGATLTATTNGALTIDSYSVNTNDRLLVQNEATQANNGIYVATNPGSSGAPYVLTRSTDFDQSAQVSGAYVFVDQGTTNANAGFVCTSTGSITFGSTAITWTQFSGAGEITAGAGLSKSGNTLSLMTPVPLNQGGTGSTTQNFVDLSSNQTIAGTKTFSSTITGNISGNAGTVTTIPGLTGDVTSSGSSNVTTVGKVQGINISGTAPSSSGQVLTSTSSTGAAWQAPPAAPVTTVAGRTGAIVLAESDITNLSTDLSNKAPLASPALTGIPTAPTATVGTNTTQLATTAFVTTAQPANATSSTPGLIQLSGDLGNTATAPKVESIQGVAISGTPSANQVLTASGSSAAGWSALPAASFTSQGVVRQLEFNIADYGAVGDGYTGGINNQTYNSSATNNTTAIQNAINAASTAGGGTVVIPPLCYMTDTLTLPDSVAIRGVSRKCSGLILKTGTTTGCIFISAGFGTGDAATSTDDSWSGISYLNISNLFFDGNQTNQTVSSGQGDYRNQFAVIKIYGWHMEFDNVEIRNAHENGLYTEHAANWDSNFNEYQFGESSFTNLFVKNFGGAGWCNRGPHDSTARSVYLSNYDTGNGTNAYAGYVQEGNGNYGSSGMILHNLHAWGQFQTNAVYFSGTNVLDGFVYAEGATQSACYIYDCTGMNMSVTCGYSVAGIELAGTSSYNYIRGSCQSNLTGGLFQLDGACDNNTLIHSTGYGVNPSGAIFDLSTGSYTGNRNTFVTNRPLNTTIFAGTAASGDRIDIQDDNTTQSAASAQLTIPLGSNKFQVTNTSITFPVHSSSVGYVWTATDTAGNGSWQASSGGGGGGGTSPVDWISAVNTYGADPSGSADSTSAINSALAAASSGDVVYLAAGTYKTSAPLTIPQGVTLMGANGGWAEPSGNYGIGGVPVTGSIIAPSSAFTPTSGNGAAVIYLTAGDVQSGQQQIRQISIDGQNAPSSNSIHGIQAYNAIAGVKLRDVLVYGGTSSNLGGNGLDMRPGPNQNPDFWDVAHCKFSGMGGYGVNMNGASDSYFVSVEATGNTGSGWNITNCGNCRFLGCKGENSGTGQGWYLTAASGFTGELAFHGCTSQFNHLDGWYLTGPGAGVYQFTGCRSVDDGESSGAAMTIIGSFAGVAILTGWASVTGATTPASGLKISSASGSAQVIVSNSLLWGYSAAVSNDGSAGNLLVGSNVIYRTGAIGSPTTAAQPLMVPAATAGTTTLNGSTAVSVSASLVTASTLVMLTIQTPGGTPGSPYVASITAGTGFTVKSTSAGDTSTVAWMLVNN